MRVFLVIAAGFLLLSCAHGPTGAQDVQEGDSPAPGLFRVYRDWLGHLSFIRRGGCPMHPSCSEYARQAIERFGPVRGWIMACDRLMRCGRDELYLGKKIWVDGAWKIYDPVAQNDLWTKKPEPSAP